MKDLLDDRRRLACAALCELLSYPRDDLGPLARRLAAIAGRGTAEAAALSRFAAAVEAFPPGAIEELYTSTFDVEPACVPYVGVQLLGDGDTLRGLLLAKLAELYAHEGYTPREELPDHVAEVLGFLAVAAPGAARDDLVRDGLLPALGKMVDALEERGNPYREVLAAARELLAPLGVATDARAAVEVRP
ncbi:MAG TPA: nitrate reductase molybdenum cofactor assembly chaperone [Anaeromyxobacter sp.]|nr:nitrate reductase molybdenum cofactor assembly chaperone [Anaeromyxobacter sp.]